MIRDQITLQDMRRGFDHILQKFEAARAKKGNGAFSSAHEILGCVSEEFDEFKDEVHKNSLEGQISELTDTAIAAIWGIICLKAKKS